MESMRAFAALPPIYDSSSDSDSDTPSPPWCPKCKHNKLTSKDLTRDGICCTCRSNAKKKAIRLEVCDFNFENDNYFLFTKTGCKIYCRGEKDSIPNRSRRKTSSLYCLTRGKIERGKETNYKIQPQKKLHIDNINHQKHLFNLSYHSNLLPTFDFQTKMRYKPY
jgi:hypothetical protein